jgi:RimJ/RimL family protein N-acetyltransferase
MIIPRLETERLILRGFSREDFATYSAMRADPHVMQFIGKGDMVGEEDAWAKFLQILGHWPATGYGMWAVEEKSTNRHIGEVGFADKKRPKEHPASGAPEMGWLLAADAHGKGYATEAVRAGLGWGRAQFGQARVVCVISTGNAASIRVAEKCEFRQFATATRYGLGRLVFEQCLPR